MDIGEKVRRLRLRLGLTQEELAARTELSKGFISQLENNITSPSIATLMDILETRGTSAAEFFRDQQEGKVVYRSEDMFVKEGEDGSSVTWLVTDAQKYETLLRLARAGFIDMVKISPGCWLLDVDSWNRHLLRCMENPEMWDEGSPDLEEYRFANGLGRKSK